MSATQGNPIPRQGKTAMKVSAGKGHSTPRQGKTAMMNELLRAQGLLPLLPATTPTDAMVVIGPNLWLVNDGLAPQSRDHDR